MSDQLSVEVIEKVIDSQIENTKALTSLKNKIDDQSERVKGMEKIFHNGFRADIKDCKVQTDKMSIKQEELAKEIHKLSSKNEKLEKIEQNVAKILDQNKFWSRLTSILVAVGAIVAVIYKLVYIE